MSEQGNDEHPLEDDYPDAETLEEEIPLDVGDDEETTESGADDR